MLPIRAFSNNTVTRVFQTGSIIQYVTSYCVNISIFNVNIPFLLAECPPIIHVDGNGYETIKKCVADANRLRFNLKRSA